PQSPPPFLFNPPSTTAIYTLSLHDALPISVVPGARVPRSARPVPDGDRPLRRRGPAGREFRRKDRHVREHRASHSAGPQGGGHADRKSTRLNSSHVAISYAVFCLKKKKYNF